MRKRLWCSKVFFAEKQQKATLNFSLESFIATTKYE